jgi:hypothetical protein
MKNCEPKNGKITKETGDSGERIDTSPCQDQSKKFNVMRRSVFFEYKPPVDVLAIKAHRE